MKYMKIVKNAIKYNENATKWEIEKIDRAIIETFPDIIEEQIFGDDDD